MDKNQMFSQMNQAALARLEGRDPGEIARNAGIFFDSRDLVFLFSSLGTDLVVTYPGYDISPQVPGWHRLLILHYLDLADGTPLTGKDIPFSQMQAGMVRGGCIDRKCELAIQVMQDLDGEKLAAICEALGGEKINTNADVSYRMPFLPRFPVTWKVWLPDEEFPAFDRLLVDASADHYFTIEDAVTVAEILLEKISQGMCL